MTTSQPASARTFGRDPSLLDPIAPDWLVRILAPKKAPVPWLDMARTALTVTGPLALGLLTGQGGLAVFGSMGGLVGSFGDKGGTFAQRGRRVAAGAGFALVGLLLGRATLGQGVLAVLVVAGLAVLSALLSSVSANLSFAGLQLLVYVAIAGSLPAGVGLGVVLPAFAAGVGWALVLSFVQTRLDPPADTPRDAEVGVLRDLAAVLREPPAGPAERHERRRRATHDLSEAYDDLVGARAISPGRRGDLRRLSALMTATFGLVTATYAHLDAGRGRGAEVAPLLDRLADLAATGDVRAVRPAVEELRGRVEAVGGADPGLLGLTTALNAAGRTLVGPGSDPLRGERSSPTAWLVGRKAWVFAARLGLTMAVAETVRQLVPLEKPYWIVLTAALVLKPDLGSVFARGVQRTLGTLVGVVLGVLIVQLVPAGGWLLLAVAVLAFCFPFGASRNYGLLATLITPLVLLLLDFGAPVSTRLGVDRLLDTALGAGVVLVVGYLLWPSTWRPRLGEHIAAAVEVLGSYARVAFADDPTPVGPARRRAYRAMSDVRAELQSTLAEPPPLSRAAAAWWPLIVQLEQATDDLSDASYLARHRSQRPSGPDVAQLVAGFDDLAAALRGHRPPRDLPAPGSPLLAGLVGDLEGARRIATGPGDRSGPPEEER